ncbi:MAG: hypothetical protein ACK4OP_10745 [Gemmobacter sp.]
MTLAANGVSVSFAGVCAIEDVSVALARGEIVGLVGPNGAGTLARLSVVAGVVPALPAAFAIAMRC